MNRHWAFLVIVFSDQSKIIVKMKFSKIAKFDKRVARSGENQVKSCKDTLQKEDCTFTSLKRPFSDRWNRTPERSGVGCRGEGESFVSKLQGTPLQPAPPTPLQPRIIQLNFSDSWGSSVKIRDVSFPSEQPEGWPGAARIVNTCDQIDLKANSDTWEIVKFGVKTVDDKSLIASTPPCQWWPGSAQHPPFICIWIWESNLGVNSRYGFWNLLLILMEFVINSDGIGY